MILSCKNIKMAFGVRTVLDDVTFSLEEKEKTAIVGANGAGKSTLFKILAGEMQPSSGKLYISKNAKFGYFSQSTDAIGNMTVYEHLLSVFDELIEMEKEIHFIEKEMGQCVGEELKSLILRYDRLSYAFEEKNGYGYKSRINGVLKGLGLGNGDKLLSELSGGEKTRLTLGNLLLSSPGLLLLDEPTNHLDIDSVMWLEDYLKNYQGAIMIISHDRYFLDRIVTRVIEIENAKSKIYNGNYTYYAKKKESDLDIQMKHFISSEKEIKRQELVIKKLRSFNREKSIKRAESREKLLEKTERIEKPDKPPAKIKFGFTLKRESGFDVLTVKDICKSFEKTLFENVSFHIKKKEKIALIGPNGVGKTTLFKIITGKINPDGGTVTTGANVSIAYYDQEHQDLDETKTIFDDISDNYPALSNQEIRNAAAAFAFTGDNVFKAVKTLSGGEKGRVCLLKIMLGDANFLIMDEPTNHLDIPSREILENALKNYSGTCLFISHDRYFINSIADKIIELDDGRITIYSGNYDYYAEKKLQPAPEEKKITENKSLCKEEWTMKKELRSDERKKETRIQRLEKEIEQTERMLDTVNEKLGLDEICSDSALLEEIYNEKIFLDNKLLKLYEDWEILQ